MVRARAAARFNSRHKNSRSVTGRIFKLVRNARISAVLGLFSLSFFWQSALRSAELSPWLAEFTPNISVPVFFLLTGSKFPRRARLTPGTFSQFMGIGNTRGVNSG